MAQNSEPSTHVVAPEAVPVIPRGVRLVEDAARGGFVLLAPERVYKLDSVARHILERCDGKTSVAGIVDNLVTAFNAPRAQIERDVTAFLGGLAEKRVLEWR